MGVIARRLVREIVDGSLAALDRNARPNTNHAAVVLVALLVTTAAFASDPRAEATEMLGQIASALSQENAAEAMSFIDKKALRYHEIERRFHALTAVWDIASAIEIIDVKGDEVRMEFELEWLLERKSREPAGGLDRKKGAVKAVVEKVQTKKGKVWKVISLSPVEFFE